jgi:hypothetical protein
MSDVRKVPIPLPVVVTRPAFPESDEEVEENPEEVTVQNPEEVTVYTSTHVTQHTRTIKSILYKPLKDPRITTTVTQYKPIEKLLTKKPGTYMTYDPEDPNAPNPTRCRSIQKRISFNLEVQEVVYTEHAPLKTTIAALRVREWNNTQKMYDQRSAFCIAHGYRMIPCYDESSGLYQERWYNPEFNTVYNLKKTCDRINKKIREQRKKALRKAGFVMLLTYINGAYHKLWTKTSYKDGLGVDDAFRTIQPIDIRGRRLKRKRDDVFEKPPSFSTEYFPACEGPVCAAPVCDVCCEPSACEQRCDKD